MVELLRVNFYLSYLVRQVFISAMGLFGVSTFLFCKVLTEKISFLSLVLWSTLFIMCYDLTEILLL